MSRPFVRPAFTLLGAALLWTTAVPAQRTALAAAAVAGREQTADQQVRHVLGRLTFGARPGDVERVGAMGVDAWIAAQLQPSRIAEPAIAPLLDALATYTKSPAELRREYPPPMQVQQQLARAQQAGALVDSQALRRQAAEGRRVYTDIQTARVLRAVASERQLEEVLVDFWLNHFSVFGTKNAQMRYYLAQYEREVIRPRVLGRFRELLGAVAASPAMLVYLDNVQSTADTGRPTLGRPMERAVAERRRQQVLRQNPALANVAGRRGLNENYARELLELHTLGVDGGYTQQDVIEVARAFTGWTVRPPAMPGADGFQFNPLQHDAGEKRVLGVTLRAGRGIDDGEQVLDILAAHPSTARFIAHKLAVRFVSDAPPAALVERAAAVFTRTRGDLREVVRTIVTSPEFFAADAYRAKVKSPFELVVSAARAMGAAPDRTPQTAQMIASMGQPVFGRQTPDGWPETGDAWINTGAILNRINFGVTVAAGRLPGAAPRSWPLLQALADRPREEQVDGVARALLGGEISPETRQILVEGSNPLADGALAASESPLMPRGRPLQGLQQIVGLALGSPEFQRR